MDSTPAGAFLHTHIPRRYFAWTVCSLMRSASVGGSLVYTVTEERGDIGSEFTLDGH